MEHFGPNHIEIADIKVTQEDIEIEKDTQLDIFKNDKYNGTPKIAPGSYGEYKFCLSNETNSNIQYNLKFTDEMKNKVNMVYRLKVDNIYIKGNEKKYVRVEELNLEDIIILKGSKNIYTLEWYWEDSDYLDSIVGSQKETQYYILNLIVNTKMIVNN